MQLVASAFDDWNPRQQMVDHSHTRPFWLSFKFLAPPRYYCTPALSALQRRLTSYPVAMSTSDSSQWFSWLPVPDDVQARADKKGLGHSAVEIERRKQNRRAIARVSEKLDRLYASGVPFFTKYALRDIAEQVERLPIHTGDPRETRVHTFVLQGLDGNPVEVTVTLGTTRPGQSPETYWLE